MTNSSLKRDSSVMVSSTNRRRNIPASDRCPDWRKAEQRLRAYREGREGVSYFLPKSQRAPLLAQRPRNGSLAGDGADPALLAAIITDRASNSVDPSTNGRIRDDAPAPDPRKKLILLTT